MAADAPDSPSVPDPKDVLDDPSALKHAHERTGRMLKQAGLPFDEEEFDDSLPRASSDEPRPDQATEHAPSE